jgi:hypothetical protein
MVGGGVDEKGGGGRKWKFQPEEMPDHWEEQFPYKALLTGQKVRILL